MINSRFSIGGQFQYDPKIFYDTPIRNINKLLFDGASSSLRFIITKLNFRSDEYALLPSYLCPTIIENFNKMNVKIIFYSINYDFSINLVDLKSKLNNNKIKAIYFIEYFGMQHNYETIEFLKMMKSKGYTIIQDAVHTLYLNEYDNFIVNLITIKCKLMSGTPTANEHSKLIWLKKENLDSLKWAPADIPAVMKLISETESAI